MSMTKSIGEVNERAYYEAGGLNDPGLGPNFRAGAKAVALHVLDLMAAAGATPAEAAAQLRAGRTIEEVCGGKPCGAAHGFAEWPEAPPCKMRNGHSGQHENGCFSWDTDGVEENMAALDDVPGSGT